MDHRANHDFSWSGVLSTRKFLTAVSVQLLCLHMHLWLDDIEAALLVTPPDPGDPRHADACGLGSQLITLPLLADANCTLAQIVLVFQAKLSGICLFHAE
jgi:hypothetical protein